MGNGLWISRREFLDRYLVQVRGNRTPRAGALISEIVPRILAFLPEKYHGLIEGTFVESTPLPAPSRMTIQRFAFGPGDERLLPGDYQWRGPDNYR